MGVFSSHRRDLHSSGDEVPLEVYGYGGVLRKATLRSARPGDRHAGEGAEHWELGLGVVFTLFSYNARRGREANKCLYF